MWSEGGGTYDGGVSDTGIEVPEGAKAKKVCTMLKQGMKQSVRHTSINIHGPGPGERRAESRSPEYLGG